MSLAGYERVAKPAGRGVEWLVPSRENHSRPGRCKNPDCQHEGAQMKVATYYLSPNDGDKADLCAACARRVAEAGEFIEAL